LPESDETGCEAEDPADAPGRGAASRSAGKPHVGATVALHRFDNETEKWVNTADGKTDEDGPLQDHDLWRASTAHRWASTRSRSQKTSAVFGAAATTTLRVPIREGENMMRLDLP